MVLYDHFAGDNSSLKFIIKFRKKFLSESFLENYLCIYYSFYYVVSILKSEISNTYTQDKTFRKAFDWPFLLGTCAIFHQIGSNHVNNKMPFEDCAAAFMGAE